MLLHALWLSIIKQTETVPTPFSKDVCDRMAFGITDIDGDGKLSFDEFLFAAILLGTFSQVFL